ncbi:reverse transcriptase [Gossypium australe]|uniref:Reverse transcriptase n=1 Tax=Gossypium australe TaxID=47621 RepID=A0A5B6WNR4_9ROSI|nr:reverse transcriptase [Gossypium australe]
MSKGVGDLSHLLQGIEGSISPEINDSLQTAFTEEDVLVALKGMRPTKAPRPDGFPALFFQRYWHIVGREVSDFIVAKSVANRLQGVIRKCIDEAQSAFVPGRLISYNVLLAYEMLHTFQKKRTRRKGFMAVKLDMSKAYDRVEWVFLKEVMLKMGFEKKWVELILKCVTTSSFTIYVNGHRGRTFEATRGLRQAQTRQKEIGKEVAAILGMRHSTDMEKYLGLPSVVGRRKKVSFQVLKEKILFRIKGWSNRFLSQGGKEVFIKSVLQSIPTYAMSCFLLPKSFCRELEQLMSKFWWQKAHGKQGIHWCQWQNLSTPKDEGGMGFRDMAKFNLALLAKQGWRILNNPDSLVAKVGSGKDISVLNDVWIPDSHILRLSSHVTHLSDSKVVDLIDDSSREWKKELLETTFSEDIVAKIACIPLAREVHEDMIAWRGESSGEFTVRSVYKLLQQSEIDPTAYALQNVYRNFTELELPSKVKITVRKISWNYLPTRVNMQHRRLSNILVCPRCGIGAESMDHVFREYPISNIVWEKLDISQYREEPEIEFTEWLIWVFARSSPLQCRLFCCGLWAIWSDRNRCIHDNARRSGEEIADFVKSYIMEVTGVKGKPQIVRSEARGWKPPPGQYVKVNFDAAFFENLGQAAMGVVARDDGGYVLLSCSVLQEQVASAFAAEALACRLATRIGVEMQWENVIIEGDALAVIKKSRKKENGRSKIGAFIQDIHQLKKKIGNCRFEYVPRTVNSLAHLLAIESLKNKKEEYLIGTVPEYAESLKDREMRDRQI